MKKVIKKKLEETRQHAFEKKVLQREKAKASLLKSIKREDEFER